MSCKNRETGPAFLGVSNDLFCPRSSVATEIEDEPSRRRKIWRMIRMVTSWMRCYVRFRLRGHGR